MKRAVMVFLGLHAAMVLAGEASTAVQQEESRAPTLVDHPGLTAIDGPALDFVSARDSDGFKRQTARAGAMVHYASPYEFLAVGASRDEFSQGVWSKGVNSILLAGRNVNRRTAEGYTGRLELTTNTDKIEWHGGLTWNKRFNEKAGMEMIFNRDVVETRAALDQATLANLYAVSLDYAFAERWTIIAMPTYRDFTDGNAQRGGRGWLIYNLLPEYGVSAQIKGQFYDSSRGSTQYFSPDDYQRAEMGLRMRHAFGDWRVFADAAMGRERINNEIEQPTTTLVLTGQRSFNNNITVAAQLSYFRASAAGATIDTSGDYNWRMLRLVMTVPLN